MKKQKIGISITTRNRDDLLDVCLSQLFKNLMPEKYEYLFVVVNDLSDEEYKAGYRALKKKYVADDMIWHRANERLGIAAAKNRAIKTMRDNKCDHFFLWDDDGFAIKKGWDDYYIESARNAGVNHLMHQFPLPDGCGFQITKSANGINEFAQSAGVMLYFTKLAIETVGGYRKAFGIYGLEHSNVSIRCQVAGIQGTFGAYISPERSREYIYSLDLDMNIWGQKPDLEKYGIEIGVFRSSMEGENVQAHIQRNMPIFSQIQPIYEEI